MMGLLKIAAIIMAGNLINKARKNMREEREEEERRVNAWNGFVDNISKEDFAEIVANTKKKVKRIDELYAKGPIVYGTVISQSGLSEWSFEIDFNDYGHLTGAYWYSSDNSDSNIPEYVADAIKSSIKNFSPKTYGLGFTGASNYGQKLCPYCGRAVTAKQAKFCAFCGKELGEK